MLAQSIMYVLYHGTLASYRRCDLCAFLILPEHAYECLCIGTIGLTDQLSPALALPFNLTGYLLTLSKIVPVSFFKTYLCTQLDHTIVKVWSFFIGSVYLRTLTRRFRLDNF